MEQKRAQDLINHRLIPEGEGREVFGCIDGRKPHHINAARFSIAGGGAGPICIGYAALHSLEVDVTDQGISRRILEAVLSTLGGIESFCIHGDEHEGIKRGATNGGCGYINQVLTNPQNFGLTLQISSMIRNQLENILALYPHVEEIYPGRHEEQLVVLVEDPRLCIAHYDHEMETQTFVCTQAKARELMEQLATELLKSLEMKIEEQALEIALLENLSSHLLATHKAIASHVPMATVTTCEERLLVQVHS